MPRLLKFPGSDRLYESWVQPLPGNQPSAPPAPAAPPPPPPLPQEPAPPDAGQASGEVPGGSFAGAPNDNAPPQQSQPVYSPEVERWRPLVQQAFAARGIPPQAVDKALYVIEGESGGNPQAANPTSSARGLVQMTDVHGIPEQQRLDPQASINWMADQVANHGWTDWGEGVTYEGKPFGILGLKPYNGAVPTTRTTSGEVPAQSFSGGGGTPALDAYANRVMLGTEDQFSPELGSGASNGTGQAATPPPPESQPPANAPPAVTPPEQVVAAATGDIPYDPTAAFIDHEITGQQNAGDVPADAGRFYAKRPEPQAPGNYGDVPVDAGRPLTAQGFNATQGADFVDAPTGKLRATMEANRQGKDYLASNALPASLGLLGAPGAVAAGELAASATALPVIGSHLPGLGVGLVTGRPLTEALNTIPGYEKLPEWARTVIEVAPYSAAGKESLAKKAITAFASGVGLYEGGKVDEALGTTVPGIGGPFALAGAIAAGHGGKVVAENMPEIQAAARRAFVPQLAAGEAAYGAGVPPGGDLEAQARRAAAEDAAKPLPGQTGMFGEQVDTAGKLRVPEGPSVNSDPARGEFGRQGEAFPDPNGGAQAGLLTEGTRTPEPINPRSPEGQGAAYGRIDHPTAEQTAANNNALNGMSGHDADAYTLARQLREDARDGTHLADDPTFVKSLEYLTPEEQAGIRARAKAESGSEALPGSPSPEAPRAASVEQAAQAAPKLARPEAERVAGDMTRSSEMISPQDLSFRPEAFQARDVEAGKAFNEPNVKRIVDAWDDNLFEPPIAVPDPEKPGSFIVVAGHHRAEAWRRVKGDQPMPVSVVNADIRDPKQLATVRLLADQTNTATKALNFRELIRTAEHSTTLGEDVNQTARRMGITPTAVEGLQDAARLGGGAVDRVVAEPTLEPYIKELGRGMRLYGITQEDAAGWFKRVADGPKGARPTPGMLRETIDKFGAPLADVPQGSLFEQGMFKGDRGGILKMIDENARMRTAIQKNINDTQRQIRAVTKLAGDTPAAQRDARRLSSLGEGRLKDLRDQLKTNEEDLAAAMRGEEPPARMPPSSEGPPTGVPGAPPPPAGPREFGDDLVSRMIANAESAAVAKPEMEAARSVERGKRVAAALDQLSKSDLSNPSALAATKEKLRGELAAQDFEKVTSLTADEMQTHINRAVAAGDVPYYTGITAQKGADKFGNGRIPNASEMRALGQVFGPEFQAAVERMGDVWKVRGSVEKVIEAQPIEIPTTNGEPLTVDVLAGMLKKNIPGANEATLRTVAQQLMDGERLSISVGPDGKARVTLNRDRPNALQQAANDANLHDIFEGVPDQLVPPEQPMMGGARQLSSQEHVTAGPGELHVPESAPFDPKIANRLSAMSKENEVMAGARAREQERRQSLRKLEAAAAETPANLDANAQGQAAPKRAGSREQLEFAGSDWKPTSKEGWTQHFWNAISNIVSAPKGLMATLDRSGYLRQGGLMVRHGEQMLHGVEKTMVIAEDAIDAERLRKTLGLPEDWHIPNAEEVMTAVNKGKWADVRKQAKLVVEEWGPNASPNTRNENFTSQYLNWLPGHKMAERAFTVFLNKLRADVFDSIAEKWVREGRTPKPAEFKSLATYLNAATGHGNLGQFEGAASALSRLWFSPRNVAARFQVLGQLFSPSTPYIVRKEMAKDLSVYVGAGVTLLSIAKLSGMADVELDPRSADFGKMKIGGTRIDLWGGYQQMARMVTELYTGETKDSTGHVHGADRLGVVGNYLRNKLSPSAGVGINILDQTDATGQPFSPKDLLSLDQAKGFAPLFLQDIYDAVKEHGAAGIAILPLTYMGLGASTYSTYGEQRDAAAQKQFGQPYDQLLPRQQEAVKNADAIKALADQREPSDYQKTRDATLQPIQARQDEAEKLFGEGKLKAPLPDIWHDLNAERRGARAAIEQAFAKDFDKEHQDAFHTALDGYFKIDEQAGGTADFDATEAKRQEYLAGLAPAQRQWVEDALRLGKEKQTPLRQKYLDYIDARKQAGYFDPALDKLPSSERTKKLAELDRKNPQQDALNWYFKGGLEPDAMAKAPSLNSAAGAQEALKLAPDRPVKLAGIDRPVNQTPQALQAWGTVQEKVSNFLDDAWVEKHIDRADFTQPMLTKYGRNVTYAQLTDGEKADVRGNARQAIRQDSPVTDAALAWMGYGADDRNKRYSVHSDAAVAQLKKLRDAYGKDTAKQGYVFWQSD